MKANFYIFILMLLSANLHGQMIELELYASGFTYPLDIVNAGDERLFVVERSGQIKIVEPDGNVLPTMCSFFHRYHAQTQ